MSPPTLKFNFRDPVPGDLEHHLEAIWETGTHKKPGTHTIPILLYWDSGMGVGLGSMASVRLLTNPDRLDMLHRYCIIYFVCFLSCFLDIIIAVVCS